MAELDKERIRYVVLDEEPPSVVHLHLARYAFALRHVPADGTCLDVACGSGYGTGRMAEVSRFAVGLDLDEGVLHYARGAFGPAGAVFVQGDALTLPFRDGSFDTVVSLETIEHLPNAKGFLMECRRVLKEEGLLILSTPNRWFNNILPGLTLNPAHAKEYDQKEIRALLSEHFPEVEIYHQGLSSPLHALFSWLAALTGLILHKLAVGKPASRAWRAVRKKLAPTFAVDPPSYFAVGQEKHMAWRIAQHLVAVARRGT